MNKAESFNQWADFGEKGISPYEIILDFRPYESYDLSSELNRKLNDIWKEQIQKHHQDLFNGDLLNLEGIKGKNEDYIVKLGPSSFKDYYIRKELLNEEAEATEFDFDFHQKRILQESIHVLSSVSALVMEDCFLLRKRSNEVSGAQEMISFPGSGYLEQDKDVLEFEGIKHTKETGKVIAREIEEEIGIKLEEIEKIRSMGIYEANYEGSDQNVSILSIVTADIERQDLKKRKASAEESWEFEGAYIFVPLDEKVISELLDSSVKGEELGESVVEKIENYDKTSFEADGKSDLMMLELGRFIYGEDWYENKIEELGDFIELS